VTSSKEFKQATLNCWQQNNLNQLDELVDQSSIGSTAQLSNIVVE
jgi:hypothetical protein